MVDKIMNNNEAHSPRVIKERDRERELGLERLHFPGMILNGFFCLF